MVNTAAVRVKATPNARVALRRFVTYRSPQLLMAFVAADLAVRVWRGSFGLRDLAVVAGLVLAQPFVEWVVHVTVLHCRPTNPVTKVVYVLYGDSHRRHHEDPTRPDLIFIRVTAVVMLGGIGLACVVFAPLGVATGFVAAAVLSLGYEWTHFLIHTDYTPRTRFYRSLWRGHRLHHYRNENYWFGVTNHLGDRVLGTNPAKEAVPVSATARTLAA